jgi:hypothetical protein
MQTFSPTPKRTLTAITTTLGAAALTMTLFAGAATATPNHDRDGDADRSIATHHTEDTDTNDGGTPNNVADAGDDRHPSGKDRSVEKGKSGNQGRSESDPDDDGKGPDRSNGGADKPNGSGGVDKADQDGNNGCGNDDDFEDDNEGWCGRKPKKATAPDAGTGSDSPKSAKGDTKRESAPSSTTASPSAITGSPAESTDGVPAATTGCPWIDVTDHDAAAVKEMMAGCAFGEVLSASALAGDASAVPAWASIPLRAELAATSTPSSAAALADVEDSGGLLAFTGMGLLRLLSLAGAALVVGWAALRAGRTHAA